MVQPALTALALIFVLGHETVPAALANLQAAPSAEGERDTLPAVSEPVVTEPETEIESAIAVVETAADEARSDPLTQPVINEPLTEVENLPSAEAPETIPVREVLETEPTIPTNIITRHDAGTQSYTVLLDRARLALSSAKTAKGRFTQANADGSLYGGDFAISRPGKLRFEYDAPVPVLIVSDGTTVAMEDRDLETIDRVPLGATPLGLILNDELEFTDDVIVTDVSETQAAFEITVEDASGEMPGTLTMQFNQAENALIGWRAVDAELNTTIVALQDVETNTRINPREFILRDAEDEEDER
ncbi:outer-membrane lipoprotein carrier protein LolA [Hyphomonas sp. FCG-A18]|uniref:LolA family protein n=1 Tax=Hyphomonas sp. FCG-A18 TaxID=3080019 RepID=UPI002B27F347|nr:outer-membrane lipoprotein carrier protein LolA [Hyphomonas sp. FCG-A18]